VEFAWDAAKELANIQKHKVAFGEAVETFFDANGFQLADRKHSTREPRFYWIGKSSQGAGFNNMVYCARISDSDYRLGGVATISEALR